MIFPRWNLCTLSIYISHVSAKPSKIVLAKLYVFIGGTIEQTSMNSFVNIKFVMSPADKCTTRRLLPDITATFLHTYIHKNSIKMMTNASS